MIAASTTMQLGGTTSILRIFDVAKARAFYVDFLGFPRRLGALLRRKFLLRRTRNTTGRRMTVTAIDFTENREVCGPLVADAGGTLTAAKDVWI